MMRLLLAAPVVGALMLPMSAGTTPGLPELEAKVTARTISLTVDGERVRELHPNHYRFVVKDLATTQNFHLVGPSVNRRTKVGAKTTTSWTIYLGPGTYTYRSDKRTSLRGTFTVRQGPPPA